MKYSMNAAVVLATSGMALASWSDVTVTNTMTRTVQVCPCNGEVRVSPAHGSTGPAPTGPVEKYTVTGAINTKWVPAQPKTETRAGPIVVVYSTAGTMETKTGVKIELKPTNGPVITKTVWTGPQPTDGMAWIDWDDSEDSGANTLTRSHTETATVYGPAPTDAQTEPWADWVATTRTATKYTTETVSPSNSVGPIGGSTTSSHSKPYHSSSSVSSGIGPIDGSTTSSYSHGYYTSSSMSSMSTSSASFSIGPIPGSTTTSSMLEPASSSTTSYSSSFDPIQGSTTSSMSTMSTPVTTSSVPPPVTGSTTSSAAAVTTSPVIISTTSTLPQVSTTTSAAPGTVVTHDVRGLGYIEAILQEHNDHRANHSAPALTWSDNLANIAGQTASSCVYAHDVTTGGGGYGQNIGAGYSPNQVPVMITNDMYNGEMPKFTGPYDTDTIDTSNFGAWGHFTQIVWKSTQQVGCATQYCPNGLQNAGGITPYFTVCNYYPPGNIRGAYSNVGAPLGQPIVTVIANPN